MLDYIISCSLQFHHLSLGEWKKKNPTRHAHKGENELRTRRHFYSLGMPLSLYIKKKKEDIHRPSSSPRRIWKAWHDLPQRSSLIRPKLWPSPSLRRSSFMQNMLNLGNVTSCENIDWVRLFNLSNLTGFHEILLRFFQFGHRNALGNSDDAWGNDSEIAVSLWSVKVKLRNRIILKVILCSNSFFYLHKSVIRSFSFHYGWFKVFTIQKLICRLAYYYAKDKYSTYVSV